MFKAKENTAPTIGEKVEAVNEEIVCTNNDMPKASKSQYIDLAAMAKSILNGGAVL